MSKKEMPISDDSGKNTELDPKLINPNTQNPNIINQNAQIPNIICTAGKLLSFPDFEISIQQIQAICNKDGWFRLSELKKLLLLRGINLNLEHTKLLHQQLKKRNNSVDMNENYENYKKDNN